jgi:uncharacterized membrane protein (DUF2068 family)
MRKEAISATIHGKVVCEWVLNRAYQERRKDMTAQQRPTGITVLAVLAGLGGALQVLGGLFLLSSSPIQGIAALAAGLLNLAFAYGAWTLKPWAWTLGVALEVISLLGSVVSIATGASVVRQIINVPLALFILYYLLRRDIKEAFGRA